MPHYRGQLSNFKCTAPLTHPEVAKPLIWTIAPSLAISNVQVPNFGNATVIVIVIVIVISLLLPSPEVRPSFSPTTQACTKVLPLACPIVCSIYSAHCTLYALTCGVQRCTTACTINASHWDLWALSTPVTSKVATKLHIYDSRDMFPLLAWRSSTLNTKKYIQLYASTL